jgi:hypothetical protein
MFAAPFARGIAKNIFYLGVDTPKLIRSPFLKFRPEVGVDAQ